MIQATVTELKNRLSYYLRLVKQGESIEVLDRSVPIARIQGIEPPSGRDQAQLERLLKDGVVSPAARKPAKDFLKTPPIACKVDPVEVLIEERGDR
jgi:prevent-host-death family protein